MSHRLPVLLGLAAFCVVAWSPGIASATPVFGAVEPTTPLGQYMSLTVTIDDANTTFELTGPDFSWFAFGFDTITMFGYSLIVEGTDDDRTVVEQNLGGIGDPGVPQATQDINIVDILHDEANDLTTVLLQRPNQTGDANDPDFTTSMTQLDVIWAYSAHATPEFPSPALEYHGANGRGFAVITFAPVPEPAGAALAVAATAFLLVRRRRR